MRHDWRAKIGAAVLLGFGVMSAALAGCDGDGGGVVARSQDESHEPVPTNRVAIPSSVRTNLGIRFVTVERRRIEQTLRVPGRFEYLPTARREYRPGIRGRVELLVEQFDHVEAGAVLFLIDAPGWRETQRSLAEAKAQIGLLGVQLGTFGPLFEAHEVHDESLRQSIAIWEARVGQLEAVREAGGGRAESLAAARAALAAARAEQADVQEKEATLRARERQTRADLDASRDRLRYLARSASSLVSMEVSDLLAPVDGGGGVGEVPRWSVIDRIEVRAAESGVVERLGMTNGSWADEQTPVLTVVRPDRLRFRASALQSDLGVLRDGLSARIVPPTPTNGGRAVPLQETMDGVLALGLAGDSSDRTLDLFVVPETLRDWARPGVTAQLEIVTDSTATPELAIPLAAVQRDGLAPVIFRRAPDNPNEVIRVDADLGPDDGRWVALLSGVRDEDQIVLDGAFQLMLATSGSIQQGGHFHADGTFHEGEH